MDVTHAEIIIEFKWHQSDDPFCEPYPLPRDLNRSTFLRDNKSGRDTLGQVTSYVAAQLDSQYHTHSPHCKGLRTTHLMGPKGHYCNQSHPLQPRFCTC